MKFLITLCGLLACAQAFAQTPAPTCYPPNAMNVTLTTQPAAFTDWLMAANPSWVLTWFCPSAASPSGFLGNSLVGYRSELLPNWSALTASGKASLDALWNANVASDPELAPLATAQLTATWPAPPKTTGTIVYYVIQQADAYVAVPVGTAPLGTACNASQSVDGMLGVPAAAVTWYGSVKPVAVVAPCM